MGSVTALHHACSMLSLGGAAFATGSDVGVTRAGGSGRDMLGQLLL